MKSKLKHFGVSLICGILAITGLSMTACNGDSASLQPVNPVPTPENPNPSQPVPTEPLKEDSWRVISPDGTLGATVYLDQGKLYYYVQKGNVPVVNVSELGMDLKNSGMSLLEYKKSESSRITGEYDAISGKSAHVTYDCNQTVITFDGWGDFLLDVAVRAYDDGYAFRYSVYEKDGKSGELTVKEEKSQFALPEDSMTWSEMYNSSMDSKETYSYEEPWMGKRAKNLNYVDIPMPILYRAGKTDVYSLITESQLVGSGFYGSYMYVKAENETKGIFNMKHATAGNPETDNVISYPFTSPWRLGITGDLNTVVESDLVEKLYDDAEYWKPDNYDGLTEEEKEIYEYDWVEPGVTAWNWLVYQDKKAQSDWDLQKSYVDLAAEMGWKYSILDGGWNTGLDIEKCKALTAYAHEKGVKVIAWCDALRDFANGNKDLLVATLEQWKEMGIDGIKIDFFDGQNTTREKFSNEDVGNIKWYETIYQETAKLKMVVNCHGCNKPTGERRVYPNVINREAILGEEMYKHTTKLTGETVVNQLFTRGVIGPTDFTPVVNPLNSNFTKGAQMALAVLFESGQPSMADFEAAYRETVINDFYKSIPAAREKTVFLGGLPGEYFVQAVKAGDDWFVGGINAFVQNSHSVDFSFLGEGNFKADCFIDDGKGGIQKYPFELTKDSALPMDMSANGGFAIKIKKI